MSLIRYNQNMHDEPFEISLFQTETGVSPFEDWFQSLKDEKTRSIVRARLARVRLGNFGDRKPVGEGVMELRVQHGPGYRIYYAMSGRTVVLLLTAGDKSTQKKDIKKAISYWNEYRSENHA